MLCQIIPIFCVSHQRLCLLCYIILKELRFHVGKSCKEMLYVYQTSVVLCYYQKKQPPEEFCKKRCSQKFRKIHRKTPAPESFSFNFIKKETQTQVFSCEFCKIPQNTFFVEHLRTTGQDWSSLAITVIVSIFSCLAVAIFYLILLNVLF